MDQPKEQNTLSFHAASACRRAVLIIDDDEDLLELNRTVLEANDYEVFTAQSGKAAFAVLADIGPPDLILLDMTMAGMSGPDFLKTLEKERPDLLECVPIIFLTGLDEVPASRARGFIKKPYDIGKFLNIVERFTRTQTHVPFRQH